MDINEWALPEEKIQRTIIIVEGPMGSGKTDLVNYMKEDLKEFKVRVFSDSYSKDCPDVVQYYNTTDGVEVGILSNIIQLWILEKCMKIVHEIYIDHENEVFIIDRFILGCIPFLDIAVRDNINSKIFVKTVKQLAKINYEKFLNIFLKDKIGVILLNCTPKTSYERLLKRGRHVEKLEEEPKIVDDYGMKVHTALTLSKLESLAVHEPKLDKHYSDFRLQGLIVISTEMDLFTIREKAMGFVAKIYNK